LFFIHSFIHLFIYCDRSRLGRRHHAATGIHRGRRPKNVKLHFRLHCIEIGSRTSRTVFCNIYLFICIYTFVYEEIKLYVCNRKTQKRLNQFWWNCHRYFANNLMSVISYFLFHYHNLGKTQNWWFRGHDN